MYKFAAANRMPNINIGLLGQSHINRLPTSEFPINHTISHLPTHPQLIPYTSANTFVNSLQHHPPIDAILISFGGNDLDRRVPVAEIIDAYEQLLLKIAYHDIYPFILPILPRTSFHNNLTANTYNDDAQYVMSRLKKSINRNNFSYDPINTL